MAFYCDDPISNPTKVKNVVLWKEWQLTIIEVGVGLFYKIIVLGYNGTKIYDNFKIPYD